MSSSTVFNAVVLRVLVANNKSDHLEGCNPINDFLLVFTNEKKILQEGA